MMPRVARTASCPSWDPTRTAYHFPGVDRSERRVLSHLEKESAKPMTGIITATNGMTKNTIRLSSEVSQKDVYRCQTVGPER
jgi:hypothetical protein